MHILIQPSGDGFKVLLQGLIPPDEVDENVSLAWEREVGVLRAKGVTVEDPAGVKVVEDKVLERGVQGEDVGRPGPVGGPRPPRFRNSYAETRRSQGFRTKQKVK